MASVAGPNTAGPIREILRANGIDPDMATPRGTAFEVVERHIAGALEEIEEAEDADDEED